MTSHGNSAAFSTGSHAQYPPHPSSTYAHHIPMSSPMLRNSHDTSVHLRIAVSHSVSSCFESSAPIANANGIVIEM